MGSPSHDLEHLMRRSTAKMAADYERMRQLAREDPGTSGDQAEEDWAELISQWLPETYHVVKKAGFYSLLAKLAAKLMSWSSVRVTLRACFLTSSILLRAFLRHSKLNERCAVRIFCPQSKKV